MKNLKLMMIVLVNSFCYAQSDLTAVVEYEKLERIKKVFQLQKNKEPMPVLKKFTPQDIRNKKIPSYLEKQFTKEMAEMDKFLTELENALHEN